MELIVFYLTCNQGLQFSLLVTYFRQLSVQDGCRSGSKGLRSILASIPVFKDLNFDYLPLDS